MKKSKEIAYLRELTNDQKTAFKSFSSWLEIENIDQPFVLTGFAGSGKTFTAMKFLKLVDSKKLCWTVVAPTHKAVNVLRKALDNEGLQSTWYPSTLQRLLRLKLKRQKDKEICEETVHTLESLQRLSLVVVDESSMIDYNLLKICMKCADISGTRLVFIGDPAQLTPVGEDNSAVFCLKTKYSAHLSQVVRHKGPILRLANGIRDSSLPCHQPPIFDVSTFQKCSLRCSHKKTWLEAAKSKLASASINCNPDEARILCYTNKLLEKLVPYARDAVYGDMAEQLAVLPGEVLISRGAIMAGASTLTFSKSDDSDLLINSNREMTVLDVKTEKFNSFNFGIDDIHDFSLPIIETLVANVKCGEREFSLRLQPQAGSNSRMILDQFLKRCSQRAKSASKRDSKKLWKLFFLTRDSFASVGPASVLTVHRSQGSTFENVFIAPDVFWPSDIALRQKLVYVAVSRASEEVWLVGNSDKNIEIRQWKDYLCER